MGQRIDEMLRIRICRIPSLVRPTTCTTELDRGARERGSEAGSGNRGLQAVGVFISRPAWTLVRRASCRTMSPADLIGVPADCRNEARIRKPRWMYPGGALSLVLGGFQPAWPGHCFNPTTRHGPPTRRLSEPPPVRLAPHPERGRRGSCRDGSREAGARDGAPCNGVRGGREAA